MGDWQKDITDKAVGLLDAAKTEWAKGNLRTALFYQGQLQGMADYGRMIGDRWTEYPCQKAADDFEQFMARNPLSDDQIDKAADKIKQTALALREFNERQELE